MSDRESSKVRNIKAKIRRVESSFKKNSSLFGGSSIDQKVAQIQDSPGILFVRGLGDNLEMAIKSLRLIASGCDNPKQVAESSLKCYDFFVSELQARDEFLIAEENRLNKNS